MKVNQTIIAQWFSNDQFGKRSHYILMNQERGKSSFKLLLKTTTVNIAAIEQLKDEIINALFITKSQQEYFDVYKNSMQKVLLHQFLSGRVEVRCIGFDELKPRVKCWANEFMGNYQQAFQRQADSDKEKILGKLQHDFEQEVFGSSFSI